jgi:predicted HAD superfamily Cof-like phosphohydrolase
MNAIEQVTEFHKRFNHPILKTPTIPHLDRCKLRVDLIQEEYDELITAIKALDMVEIADALCDLRYVIIGSMLEFGIDMKQSAIGYRNNGNLATLQRVLHELVAGILSKNILYVEHSLNRINAGVNAVVEDFGLEGKFDELFTEVHRSNMSKACKNHKEALDTLLYYEKERDILCTLEESKNGEFLVKRLDNLKQLKSINYSPAKLISILNK